MIGDWLLTMKWSDRTAQGFDPGLAGKEGALKVAPDVLARTVDLRVKNRGTRVGRHFQGEFLSHHTQG